MTVCGRLIGRFLPYLALVLAALIGLAPDARAQNECAMSPQTELYAENVPFMDGTLRARVFARLHARDFQMLDASPYASLIRIHVNGVQHCPQNGYGYDKYYSDTETDESGDPVLIYVEASFGFDINRPDQMDTNEHGALLPTDRIEMSWDVEGTTAFAPGCPVPPHGPNTRRISVENRVGPEGTVVRYSAGTPGRVGTTSSATPSDDDVPGLPVVTITAGTSPVTEGTDATFTLSRTGSTMDSLTVTVDVRESGAMIRGNAPTVVTFAQNQSQATLTVPTQDDSLDEDDSVITARIMGQQNATYSVGTDASATVTVRDNDVSLPVVTITAGTSPVTEGTEVTFTLRRTGATTGALMVSVDVSESGDMFDETPPDEVTFGINEAEKMLTIATATDTTDEIDSVITARLTTVSQSSPYIVGMPSSATVTVLDNDMPTVSITAGTSPVPEGTDATFTLTREGLTTAALTVSVDVSETGTMFDGTPPDEVTFGPNQERATLRVATMGDDVDESNSVITASVEMAPGGPYAIGTKTATVTVEDDDEPGLPVVSITPGTSPVTEGTAATFTLSRTGATTDSLTVTVNASESGTMFDGTPPDEVTFAQGDVTATLTVDTEDDSLDEDDSVITARIMGQQNATYSVGTDASATVTVRDNDLPTVTIREEVAQVQEGTDAVFILERAGSTTTTLTVTVTVSETESMLRGTPPGQATFGAGDDMATLRVATMGDDVDESNSVVTATVTAGQNAPYEVTAPASASVTVEDDDEPGLPVVSITPGTSSVTEGTEATFTLRRTGATTAALTVNVDVSETGDMIHGMLPDQVVFEIGEMLATVTIQTEEDAVDEHDSVITVRVTPAPGVYSVGANLSASVTVRDNDGSQNTGVDNNGQVSNRDTEVPVVTILPGPTPVREGAEALFTLRRTGATTAALTVNVDVSETGDMIHGSAPAGVTFDPNTTLTLLTVPTAGDKADEADSVITARLAGGTGYTVGTEASAAVTVQDDDEAPLSEVGINDELLPRVTQAMVSSTLSAISNRMDQAAPDGVKPQATPLSAKTSSLETVLGSLLVKTQGGSQGLKRLLGGKSFFLPLDAGGGRWEGVSVWGRGDYRDLGGGNDRPIEWNGDLTNIHLGADKWLRPNILAGLAISWSEGDFDYRERLGMGRGDYDSELTSVHPYISWTSPDNILRAWAAIGYGWGEVEIDDGSDRYSSDTRLKTGAVGASGQLATVHDVLMSGTSTLRIKAQGNVSEIQAKGSSRINRLTADMQRVRLALEGKHVSGRGSGRLLIPSVEVGLRHDSGDGLTGTGVEIGSGVRYTDPNQGLTLEGQARVLLDHEDDYDEWGIQGEIRVDPGPGGHGLSLSLTPSWGLPASTVGQLWSWDGSTDLPGARPSMTGRLNATLGYGLPALGGLGLWMPYADISLVNKGGMDFRLGSRFEVIESLSLGVEGGLLGDTVGPSDYGIGFWSEIQF